MKRRSATNSTIWSWPLTLVWVIGCSSLIALTAEQVSAQHAISRFKRQVLRDRQARQEIQVGVNSKPPRPLSTSSPGASFADANLQTPSLRDPQAELASGSVGSPVASEPPVVAVGASTGFDPDRPAKGKGKKQKKRPAGRVDGDYGPDEDEDEECYEDEEYDYHQPLFSNPMQQFRRMMNRAFDRMQGDYYDYAPDNGRGGGSRALSSSISGGDGYSKAISSVTSNGRTQGLVSETRNGRTKVRRLGPKGSSADYEDDSYDA